MVFRVTKIRRRITAVAAKQSKTDVVLRERKPSMVGINEITEISRQIVNDFQPEKIILFGSYAYGTPDSNSDVDLLVILPFKGKPFRKSLEVLERINPQFSIDLLVRDPEDINRRYREGDPLIREALDKGKVLYEHYN
jgi:uncharacterized protein